MHSTEQTPRSALLCGLICQSSLSRQADVRGNSMHYGSPRNTCEIQAVASLNVGRTVCLCGLLSSSRTLHSSPTPTTKPLNLHVTACNRYLQRQAIVRYLCAIIKLMNNVCHDDFTGSSLKLMLLPHCSRLAVVPIHACLSANAHNGLCYLAYLLNSTAEAPTARRPWSSCRSLSRQDRHQTRSVRHC